VPLNRFLPVAAATLLLLAIGCGQNPAEQALLSPSMWCRQHGRWRAAACWSCHCSTGRRGRRSSLQPTPSPSPCRPRSRLWPSHRGQSLRLGQRRRRSAHALRDSGLCARRHRRGHANTHTDLCQPHRRRPTSIAVDATGGNLCAQRKLDPSSSRQPPPAHRRRCGSSRAA